MRTVNMTHSYTAQKIQKEHTNYMASTRLHAAAGKILYDKA